MLSRAPGLPFSFCRDERAASCDEMEPCQLCGLGFQFSAAGCALHLLHDIGCHSREDTPIYLLNCFPV